MQAEGGGEPDELLEGGRDGERAERRVGGLLDFLVLLLLLLRGGVAAAAAAAAGRACTCLPCGGGGRPGEFVVDAVAAQFAPIVGDGREDEEQHYFPHRLS